MSEFDEYKQLVNELALLVEEAKHKKEELSELNSKIDDFQKTVRISKGVEDHYLKREANLLEEQAANDEKQKKSLSAGIDLLFEAVKTGGIELDDIASFAETIGIEYKPKEAEEDPPVDGRAA
jgi:uncharacterized protein YydD (DUF2326 family)